MVIFEYVVSALDETLAITRVWTEFFGLMRAPHNRQHELFPNKSHHKNIQKNGQKSNFDQKNEKSIFLSFIRIQLMTTISGSSHGPKNLEKTKDMVIC